MSKFRLYTVSDGEPKEDGPKSYETPRYLHDMGMCLCDTCGKLHSIDYAYCNDCFKDIFIVVNNAPKGDDEKINELVTNHKNRHHVNTKSNSRNKA
jgi:hypothetical protein